MGWNNTCSVIMQTETSGFTNYILLSLSLGPHPGCVQGLFLNFALGTTPGENRACGMPEIEP